MAWSRLEGTYGRTHVYRYKDAAYSPGGTFTLSFDNDTTSPIPWQASAAYVETALEALSEVGDVTVTKEELFPTVSSWLIEFTTIGTPANIGDLPLFKADGFFLTGTSVSIAVEEVSAGCCTVEISVNGGAEFTAASDGKARQMAVFRYQDRAMVQSVEPNTGPASGGTPVVLHGAGFNLPLNATPGASDDSVCVFGGRLKSPAVTLNFTAVACTSPPTPLREAAIMSVAIMWPGSVGLSTTTAVFTYFEDAVLGPVMPLWGSNAGGFSMAVSLGRGSFSVMDLDVTCVIEVRLPSKLNDGYAVREYITSAAPLSRISDINFIDANARAEIILSNEVYLCNTPGLGDFFPGVNAADWLENDWHAIALVSLSGNRGIDRTPPQVFHFVPKPTVVEIEPSLGADGGGTLVTVHGTRFRPTYGAYDDLELLCRFGHTKPVPASYISDSAVTCKSPPHSNKPAIMSVVVEGASVFHSTQEILLRIPSPMSKQANTSRSSVRASVAGTWTLSLENVETYGMDANVTAHEVSIALSALANVGKVMVIAESSVFDDQYAGLSWNETIFTVNFLARGGHIPPLSANTSDLRFAATEEEGKEEQGQTAGADAGHNELPRLVPTGSVRIVHEGHDGAGVVREVQVLRTNRLKLTGEVQTVTVKTVQTPTAEVGKKHQRTNRNSRKCV